LGEELKKPSIYTSTTDHTEAITRLCLRGKYERVVGIHSNNNMDKKVNDGICISYCLALAALDAVSVSRADRCNE
jgi:hypothetical protein